MKTLQIKLKAGDYFAIKGLSREQYNVACEMLIVAGSRAGEYQRLPLELPREGNPPHREQIKGCFSTNFGVFEYVGWRMDKILHFCSPVNVDNVRLLELESTG